MNNFWSKLNKPTLALAPMAGFTDSAFREICKKFGADVVYSEMASASGLFYNPKKTLELLKFNSPPHQNKINEKQTTNKLNKAKSKVTSIQHNIWCGGESERPYVVQLFGSNPDHFAKAARIITKKIKPDGIDINMGCPVKKVTKTGAGCALMADHGIARKIIEAVCENTNVPVSIKIRAGIYPVKSTRSVVAKGEFNRVKNITAINFIQKIKDLPFSAVMVHCRTYEQGFSSEPDYSIAEKMKKMIPDKIVLANGGINSAEEAVKILEDYPTIDGLGIARGALGQPWIFGDIKNILSPSPLGRGMEGEGKNDFNKIKNTLLTHARLVQKNKGLQGLKEFRAHLGWYIKGFPGASELRRKLVLAKDIEAIKKLLE